MGTLYKVKYLSVLAWQTALSNCVAAAGFGIILGWLTERWDEPEARKRNAKSPRGYDLILP